MNRTPGACVAAVVVASLLAGCTGDKGTPQRSGQAQSREQQQVNQLRALPFGESNIAVVTGLLASVGVGVHNDTAVVTEGKPVRVMAWQARNLAIEAANGGGVPGEVLSAVAPVPQGAPPVPYLVAAWIKTYDSVGAKFARELMGDQDWKWAEDVLFPNLVLTLFLADATAGTRVPSRPSAQPGAQSMALARLSQGGPCTTATTFVQHALAAVANALKVDTSGGGFLGFLGTIWNVAVDLATGVVKGLIDTVTRPVVNLMVDVFGLVATIMQVSSFLVKWRAELRADPSHTRFGVDAEVITGQLQLNVTHNQLPIPAIVVDCARAVDVDLSNAGSAAGSKVTWRSKNNGRADLSTRSGADSELSQDKTARYRYHSGQEDAELAKSPETETFALQVWASVARNDVQKARELFTKLLLDQLPEPVRGIASGLAKNFLDQADHHLTAITGVNASGRVFITYHVRKATPTPSTPDPGNSGGKKATVPAACPSAAVAEFGFQSIGSQTYDGVLECFYLRSPSEGQLGVGITHEKRTTQPCPGEPVDIPGADAACFDDDGQHTPGLRVFVSNGGMLIAGGVAGRDELIAITKRILTVG